MHYKKLLLIVAICAIAINSNAQVKKGKSLLGTSILVGFHKSGYENSESNKQTQVTIAPVWGFGIGKNWIIGSLAEFGYTQYKSGVTGSRQDVYAYSLGVFARKFFPLTDNLGFFGQSNIQGGIGSKKDQLGTEVLKRDLTIYAARVFPGMYYNTGKKIVLDLTFGVMAYINTKTSYNDDTLNDYAESDFAFSIQDGLGIGVKIIL